MAEGAGTERAGAPVDRIVFLGHSTVLIELDGVRLLTDPLLRGRVAHLRRRAARVEEHAFADLDAVLISHLHHDHLDIASLRMLDGEPPLLVPSGAGAWLRRRRFAAVSELAPGEAAQLGAIAIEALDARHNGWRVGGPHAQSIGYLARGRRSVYFAGDTALFGEMAELAGELDVALLPIAGWGARLGPGHMDALEAARAAAMLRPRLAIPIHWGTLTPVGSPRGAEELQEPARLFAEHVARLAPSVEVRVLEPGEATTL